MSRVEKTCSDCRHFPDRHKGAARCQNQDNDEADKTRQESSRLPIVNNDTPACENFEMRR